MQKVKRMATSRRGGTNEEIRAARMNRDVMSKDPETEMILNETARDRGITDKKELASQMIKEHGEQLGGMKAGVFKSADGTTIPFGGTKPQDEDDDDPLIMMKKEFKMMRYKKWMEDMKKDGGSGTFDMGKIMEMKYMDKMLGGDDGDDSLKKIERLMMLKMMTKDDTPRQEPQNNAMITMLMQEIAGLKADIANKNSANNTANNDTIQTILLRSLIDNKDGTKGTLIEFEKMKNDSLAKIEAEKLRSQELRDQIFNQKLDQMQQNMQSSSGGKYNKIDKAIEDKIHENITKNIDKLFGGSGISEKDASNAAITDLVVTTIDRLSPTISEGLEALGRGMSRNKQPQAMNIPANPPIHPQQQEFPEGSFPANIDGQTVMLVPQDQPQNQQSKELPRRPIEDEVIRVA